MAKEKLAEDALLPNGTVASALPEDETPAVYSVAHHDAQWSLTRRSFLAAAGAAAAAAGTTACEEKEKEIVVYQQRGADGRWQSYVIDPGAAIPSGAICVCNTVRGTSGQPGQPAATPTPVAASVPTSYPSGTRPHATPTPTPVPTATPQPCSCNGHSGCTYVVTYWYPN